MSLIDAFVSKIFANLENFRYSSDQKSFQIKLRGYSHKKIHLVIIMKSHKRFLLNDIITAIAPP